MELLFKLFIW